MIPFDVPVRLGRDEARRLAADELAKAKYGGLPPEISGLLRRVIEWLGELSSWLARLLVGGPAAGSGPSPALVVLIVLLLVGVGVVVWRVGLPRWRHRAPVAPVAVDATVAPATYRERAARAAAVGDFRTAIGEEFRGLVRELEERTVLDPRPARTATEVALGAGALLPRASGALAEVAELFNRTWYGGADPELVGAAPASAEDHRRMAALARQVADVADDTDLSAAPAAATGTGGRLR